MLALPHRRVVRLLLALVAAGLLLTLAHPQPARASTEGKLVLVLDSSGSMRGRIEGGTKIAVAKRALDTVVDHLPDDAQVGLRVYGSRIESAKDPRACTDSQLVVPIGTDNKSALKDQIARYRPLGETPISYSLKQAANDLGTSGRRSIVLVSDGEETCGVDPCVTAANLAKQGIDLRIDVIGLAVSGKTRNQLRCVAERGRGSYHDANNRQQIEDSLDQLATRAFRPFQLTGTPVQGAENPAQAPTVQPGQYLDQLPGRRQRDLWYRVDRTQPGSTIHAGFTARSVGNGSAVAIKLVAPDGSTCLSYPTQNYQGLVSGGVTSWKDDPADVCNTADHLLVGVQAPTGPMVGARFELVLIEEPALASDRNLPPVETPTWERMPATTAVAAPVAGLSLSDAPTVGAGSYRASILTGETQVFAVDLAWGQRLQVQAVVGPRHGALARALGGGDKMSVNVIGPGRRQYVLLRATDQPIDGDLNLDQKTSTTSVATPAVRYLNRNDFDAAPGDLPGKEYVVVSMNRFAHPKAFLVPYTLKLNVLGTPGEGAPEYVATSPTPTPTPSPMGTVTTPPAGPTSSSTGVPLGAVVGIGAGALVLGAGATAAVLASRRRRGRAT